MLDVFLRHKTSPEGYSNVPQKGVPMCPTTIFPTHPKINPIEWTSREFLWNVLFHNIAGFSVGFELWKILEICVGKNDPE